jgi:phosphoglucomutase
MAAFFKLQGLTLLDAIDKIYQEYGYYSDALDSFTFKGIDGQDKIKLIVDKFRSIEVLKQVFADIKIVEDYKSRVREYLEAGNKEKIELPSSNVIKIHLSDQSWFAVRPSGTEPKLKIYYSVKANSSERATSLLSALKDKVKLLVIENYE